MIPSISEKGPIMTGILSFIPVRVAAVILIVVGVILFVIGACLILSRDKKKLPQKIGDIEVYSKSIIGDRSYQQDFCLLPKDICTDQIRNIGMLAIVCDGMGGMEGGERASRCCAETVYSGYYQIGSTDDICDLLRSLIIEANKEVFSFTAEDGRRLNSGTTIVAAVYLNSKIYWASAGDSRIYLYHNGELSRITRDHNLRLRLQKDLDDGLISREQFDSAKQKEALISYVGMGQNIIIDTGELSFPENSGDILILCSDGIYKTAPESVISKTIGKTQTAEKLPEALVSAAMSGGQSGKHDNISAIVIKRN